MPPEPDNADFLKRHPEIEPAELAALIASHGRRVPSREIFIAVAALCVGLVVAGGLALYLANTATEVAPHVAREVVTERLALTRREANIHIATFRDLAREGVELVGAILERRLGLQDARRDAGVVRARFHSLARDLRQLDLVALFRDGSPRLMDLIEAASRVLARLLTVIDDLEVLAPLGQGVRADLSELDENMSPDRTAIALREAVAKLAAGSEYAAAWNDFGGRVESAWNDLIAFSDRTRVELQDPSAITREIGERLPAAVVDRAF